MKHGVIIIQHKHWDTKQVWNCGNLVATYRHVPKKLHFRSRMVNDENQDLSGAWPAFMALPGSCSSKSRSMAHEEETHEIVRRVLAGLKPAGVVYLDATDAEEASEAKIAVDALVQRSAGSNISVKVGHRSVEGYQGTRKLIDVIVARKETLQELFDLSALYQDYASNLPELAESFVREFDLYHNWRVADFFAHADTFHWDRAFPMWVTGLIVGYPVENTISLYNLHYR